MAAAESLKVLDRKIVGVQVPLRPQRFQMNVHEAIAAARSYLFRSHTVLSPEVKGEISNWELDASLQYLLCHAFDRMQNQYGHHNIVEKDIHMLVESWIMAEGTKPGHCRPLIRKGTPRNL